MLREAPGRLAHAQGDAAKASGDAAINCGRGLMTEMEAKAAVEAMHRQGLEAVARVREIGQREVDANRDAVRDDARRAVNELYAYLQAELKSERMADSRRLEEAVERQRNQAEWLLSEYQRLEAAKCSAEERAGAKEAEVRNEGQQFDDAGKRFQEGRSELKDDRAQTVGKRETNSRRGNGGRRKLLLNWRSKKQNWRKGSGDFWKWQGMSTLKVEMPHRHRGELRTGCRGHPMMSILRLASMA